MLPEARRTGLIVDAEDPVQSELELLVVARVGIELPGSPQLPACAPRRGPGCGCFHEALPALDFIRAESQSGPKDTRVGRTRQNQSMVSTFGWLDTDSEQRRKMLEVVDLFKEEGTVDELGFRVH